MDATELMIEAGPVTKNGRVKLVAHFDGKSFTDTITVTSSKKRIEYAETLASRWACLAEAKQQERIAERLEAIASQPIVEPETRQGQQQAESPSWETVCQQELERTPSEVIEQAGQLLASPKLGEFINNSLSAVGIAGERSLAMSLYLVGTSRLLSKPLSAIVQGSSSSGKSFLIERVSQTFPPECLLVATSITTNALYYLPPGSLVNRWVVAGERSRMEDDDRAEATRALREILSGGRLSKLVPYKDGSGNLATRLIEQEGPIAYVESTTLHDIFDEDKNRSLLLMTDERAEQTRRILQLAADRFAGEKADHRETILLMQTVQRLLQRYDVVVPFAPQIAERLPERPVEIRRAFPHVVGMVQASAILHQRQRSLDDEGRLIADIGDYRLAVELLNGPIGRLIGGQVSPTLLALYDELCTAFKPDTAFTTTDAISRLCKHAARTKVGETLKTLAMLGYLHPVSAGSGNRPAVWKIIANPNFHGVWPGLPKDHEIEIAFHASSGSKAETIAA